MKTAKIRITHRLAVLIGGEPYEFGEVAEVGAVDALAVVQLGRAVFVDPRAEVGCREARLKADAAAARSDGRPWPGRHQPGAFSV